MAGVDLMEQLKLAYQLDRRSKFRFYLHLLFDQFDVALVDSHIVYKKLENKDLPLKEFKMCMALKLNPSFVSWKLSCLNHHLSKCIKTQRPGPILPSHFPTFLETKRRCTVCFQAVKQNRTFPTCSTCDVALCLQNVRSILLQYHL